MSASYSGGGVSGWLPQTTSTAMGWSTCYVTNAPWTEEPPSAAGTREPRNPTPGSDRGGVALPEPIGADKPPVRFGIA